MLIQSNAGFNRRRDVLHSQEKLHVERKVVQSKPPKNRLLVYTRKMHRTMILHRELLRCLPKLFTQKEESRIIDLDRYGVCMFQRYICFSVIFVMKCAGQLASWPVTPSSHGKNIVNILYVLQSVKSIMLLKAANNDITSLWNIISDCPVFCGADGGGNENRIGKYDCLTTAWRGLVFSP